MIQTLQWEHVTHTKDVYQPHCQGLGGTGAPRPCPRPRNPFQSPGAISPCPSNAAAKPLSSPLQPSPALPGHGPHQAGPTCGPPSQPSLSPSPCPWPCPTIPGPCLPLAWHPGWASDPPHRHDTVLLAGPLLGPGHDLWVCPASSFVCGVEPWLWAPAQPAQGLLGSPFPVPALAPPWQPLPLPSPSCVGKSRKFIAWQLLLFKQWWYIIWSLNS